MGCSTAGCSCSPGVKTLDLARDFDWISSVLFELLLGCSSGLYSAMFSAAAEQADERQARLRAERAVSGASNPSESFTACLHRLYHAAGTTR